MTRALLLDRDGTLIDVVRDEETGVVTTAFHPSHLRLLPGVVDGLTKAQRAGFSLGIATNQPGPAKGHFSRDAVARTNAALVSLLAEQGIVIQALRVCLHHPEGGPGGDASLVRACDCRKPAPGLLTALLADLHADASRSWMVGDTASDEEAGRRAHTRTGLVFPRGRCELCPLRDAHGITADVTGPSFLDVVDALLARS